MKTRVCIIATLIAQISGFLFVIDALAIDNSVDSVTSSPIASSVVKLPRCSGVLIHSHWVLTVAHCADTWSDRTVSADRDVNITVNQPEATFKIGITEVRVPIDRVVRVDGASSLTNSLALFHLANSAPHWARPVPLYRGELPEANEVLEVFGYGGSGGTRKGGRVTIIRREWQGIDNFWSLLLRANPSKIQRGDSGGPLLIAREGRKYLAGVNWRSPAKGAATFDMDWDRYWNPTDRYWNPVGSLIERIISPGATIREGVYEVRTTGSNKCMDVRRSSRDDGANIIQFNCTNATNQQWRFVGKSGYYEISSVHSSKCLDVPRSSQFDRIEIIQYQCLGTTNQRWRLIEVGPEAYELQAEHSAKCLDVPHGATADGVKITQSKCTGTLTQRWRLTYKYE